MPHLLLSKFWDGGFPCGTQIFNRAIFGTGCEGWIFVTGIRISRSSLSRRLDCHKINWYGQINPNSPTATWAFTFISSNSSEDPNLVFCPFLDCSQVFRHCYVRRILRCIPLSHQSPTFRQGFRSEVGIAGYHDIRLRTIVNWYTKN